MMPKKGSNYYQETDSVQVLSALRSADCKFMLTLAKYGVNGNISSISLFHRKIAEDFIQNFLIAVDKASNSRCSYHVSADIKLLLEKSQTILKRSEKDTPSLKRIIIVLMGINAISYSIWKKFLLQDYIKGLHTYFEMIPDPYLTIEEVRLLLIGFLEHVNKSVLLEAFLQEFIRILPESERIYEPRTLSHLARCQVRKTLQKCDSSLPVVVSNCALPQRIKDFILCEPSQL